MTEMTLPDKAYSQLLEDLKKICFETERMTVTTVNKVVISGYWQMGKRLSEDELLQDEKSKKTLLTHLAHDLGFEYTFLTRVVKFYRVWSTECPTKKFPFVTWSQYKKLISVQSEDEREFYLEAANRNRWNTRELAIKVNDDYFEAQQALSQGRTLVATDDTPSEGLILRRRTDRLYVYSAALEKVIDGDTLILNFDLGFDVWKRHRIRLRGVDVPELGTPEGDAARAFVQDRLRGVVYVVIQTFKVDVYGKYVCDLFYLRGVTDKERIVREGNFLNQELLDKGLARVM